MRSFEYPMRNCGADPTTQSSRGALETQQVVDSKRVGTRTLIGQVRTFVMAATKWTFGALIFNLAHRKIRSVTNIFLQLRWAAEARTCCPLYANDANLTV